MEIFSRGIGNKTLSLEQPSSTIKMETTSKVNISTEKEKVSELIYSHQKIKFRETGMETICVSAKRFI